MHVEANPNSTEISGCGPRPRPAACQGAGALELLPLESPEVIGKSWVPRQLHCIR